MLYTDLGSVIRQVRKASRAPFRARPAPSAPRCAPRPTPAGGSAHEASSADSVRRGLAPPVAVAALGGRVEGKNATHEVYRDEASIGHAQRAHRISMDVTMISSFHKFESCTGSQFDMVLTGSEDLLNATVTMLLQRPKEESGLVIQVMEGLALFLCFCTCFFGYRLVRLVNLIAGFWVGTSLALFFLELVAPQISHETCVLVVLITLTVACFLGILCAAKRRSMYFVLGVLAAQLIGSHSYDLLIIAGYGRTAEGTSPDEAARGCISFFAVLGATLVYFYADLAWTLATCLVGAYGTVYFGIKLVVTPYIDPQYEAFTAFTPGAPRALASLACARATADTHPAAQRAPPPSWRRTRATLCTSTFPLRRRCSSRSAASSRSSAAPAWRPNPRSTARPRRSK